MTIELNRDTQVHTLWFLTDKKSFDWLGVVLKQKGQQWGGVYRFRYYRDDKAFDSQDEKSWVEFSAKEGDGPEGVRHSNDQPAARLLGEGLQAEVHTLFVNGDGIAAAKALQREDWASFKKAP